MIRSKFLFLMFFLIPGLSLASNDLDNIEDLAQSQFNILSETMVAASIYRATAPAEPLGLTGFDIGVGLTAVDLDKEIFEIASDGHWNYSYLPVPRVFAQKGLPFGIDIGASYVSVPDVDISIFGAEVKYALMSGSTVLPAVAVRLSYSKLSGIDELDVVNRGIDVSISKGFTVLTPYAGIGRTFSTSTPVNVPSLEEVDVEDSIVYAGLNINLGLNLGLEVSKVAGVTSYSGKIGIRF